MLWDVDAHEVLAGNTWDEARAADAAAEILADAEAGLDAFWPPHPDDEDLGGGSPSSLYLGSAGMIWALHRLGSSLDLGNVMEDAIRRYRTSPDFGELGNAASLWMGETGLQVVALKLGAPVADAQRLHELIVENREHPTWELMWGSPGTMLAAHTCGMTEDYEQSAGLLLERWDHETDLWTQTLYGQVNQILGPAHGFAGNAHALRPYLEHDVLSARVTRALERTAIWEDGLVNWPPSVEPPQGFDFPIRAQWCHGAPGIVATVGDLIPIELAIAGGELVWQAGPLRKGAGVCHGTAGNGYALLKVFDLTGDEQWLLRARRFAMHAIDQVAHARQRLGRGRYTLWTGDIGVALYTVACIEAKAGVPTIDVW